MSLNEEYQVIAYSELTASDFADEIEVQRSGISHITSGETKPSLDFIIIKIKTDFQKLNGIGSSMEKAKC